VERGADITDVEAARRGRGEACNCGRVCSHEERLACAWRGDKHCASQQAFGALALAP
jgi:hypothetical protein